MPSSSEITHSDLINVHDETRVFFETRGDLARDKILGKIEEVHKQLKDIPGFYGCFGVGYPFYATTPDGDLLKVPSIDRFLNETRPDIEKSQSEHGEVWPCPTCQETNNFSDLGANCKPCSRVSFKPRDFFRAVPDIDAIAVFDSPDTSTEDMVEEAVTSLGLIPFSQNIRKAFNEVNGVYSGEQDSEFPIDLHLVSLEDFMKCCQLVASGELDEQIGIPTRTLRVQWKSQPIDFSYSFAFSMEEIGELRDPLPTVLQETRRSLVENLGVASTVSIVERSRRCGAVLADQALKQLLVDKLSSWL